MDSGLNSTVLASNNEMVILPVNEPTFGTRRKSQIQVHTHPLSTGWILTIGCRPCYVMDASPSGSWNPIQPPLWQRGYKTLSFHSVWPCLPGSECWCAVTQMFQAQIQTFLQCESHTGSEAGLLWMQTFLEQNEGPGLQHLALKTDDIFHTLRELRRRSDAGGFDFMPPASDAYYRWA